MKKFITSSYLNLLLCLLPIFQHFQVSAAVSFIIYDEDFNTGTSGLTLNSGAVGTNTGSNKWIINNTYSTSVAGYTTTTSQTVTTAGGNITDAPHSYYLHIHDQGNAGGSNASYDPSVASDNFAFIPSSASSTGGSICTKGIKGTLGQPGVQLTFYHLINGTPGSYGELYYSMNSGPWIKKATYESSSPDSPTKWEYKIVEDPAFDDVNDLRFGFRWVNDGTSSANPIAWAIDDIHIIGTFDNSGNTGGGTGNGPPVTIQVINLPPVVCSSGGGTPVAGKIIISDTLCDGDYSLELLNSAGASLGITWLMGVNYPDTSRNFFVSVPGNLPCDKGYKFRANRISPLPSITGIISTTFTIECCPVDLTTNPAPVTLDTCQVCIGSVIDIPFNSTGSFNQNNIYRAELSDANGNFDNPVVLGSLPSPKEYPGMPGSISGLIPLTTLPGCNYYIRVGSNDPAATGTLYGPFCIRECDIKTNNMMDIHVCVTATEGDTVIVPIDINMWNTLTNYGVNNQFEVQILDKMDLRLVNQGGLGIEVAVTSTNLTLIVPNAGDLAALGLTLPPGGWYMRIVPTDANPDSCTVGTMIRFSYGIIGGPLQIIGDDFLCKGGIGSYNVIGERFESVNEWFIDGQPFNPKATTTMGGGLNINWGTITGTHTLTVQETSGGDCVGPMSAAFIVTILGPPSATIQGPSPVCIGDTLTYKVLPFYDHTHYVWTINPLNNAAVDTGNNFIKIKFASSGTYSLTMDASNQCGSKSGKKTIIVRPQPPVTASNDTTVCEKDTVLLVGNIGSVTDYWWMSGSSTIAKLVTSIKVTPTQTTDYSINIKDALGCKNSDTITVTAMPLPPIDPGPDTYICIGSSTQLGASGGDLYFWSPSTGLSAIDVSNPVANPEETTMYYLEERSLFGCRAEDSVKVTVLKPREDQSPVKLCDYGNGEPVVLSAGVNGVLYLWSNSETSQSITVSEPGRYTLIMSSPLGDCNVTDVFDVYLASCDFQIYAPRIFTPNGDNINDIFYLYGDKIDEITFEVFDRWGVLLYQSTSLNNGWDGTHNGQTVQNDVYVWRASVKGNIDGVQTTNLMTGMLALIR